MKNLSLTLRFALLLFVIMVSVPIGFAYDFSSDGIYYNLLNETSVEVTYAKYTYYVDCVTIPSTVEHDGNTYSVTTIGEKAFRTCIDLTSVLIPSSVTTIKKSAFERCIGLTNVTIPESVTEIGGSAFERCTGLTSVNILNSVIGESMFLDCTGLTAVTIPGSVTTISGYAFCGCTGLTNVTITNSVTSIGEGAFCGCIGLANMVIPQSVTTISDNSFSGCTGLTSVSIPNSVTTIGSGAFSGCTGLTSVSIPNSVAVIGREAFSGCTGLTSVSIPNSVTTIGIDAFSNCCFQTVFFNAEDVSESYRVFAGSIIENLIFGEGVKVIPSNLALECSGLETVTISSSVTTIGDYSFALCTGLTSVTIPNSVTTIGEGAFIGCSLKTVYFNAVELEESFENIFGGCPIENLIFGEGVKLIPSYIVSGCKSLTSVSIPNSVTAIGRLAFSGCTGLTSVSIPNSVTTIGSSAFSGCTGLRSMSIPNSVTTIGSGAFSGCTGLTSVSIPNSVTSIDGWTFYGCTGLISLTIPNSVSNIGQYAFYGCTSLTSLIIGESVEIIDGTSFVGCTALTDLTWNAKECEFNGNMPTDNIIHVIIGNGVELIPYNFVYGSRITSIDIPNSVTTIRSGAFECCSRLTDVSIGPSVTSIDSYAFGNCSSLESVICWAFSPPAIDSYDTFYGSTELLTIFVLPAALAAYQSDSNWSGFTIMPLNLEVANLSVNLPDGIDVAKYTDMKLEIAKNDSDQTLHYIIYNKQSYTFAKLDKYTTWNVSLTNQYGDEFGKIENVEIGEEDVIVTFPSLKRPQTVIMIVKLPNGQDVTAQTKVSWKDENGELLVQGNQITGLPSGRKLTYSVTLPQELATAYSLPADMTYTVKDGGNTVVCQLTAITTTQLSGKVKESTTNQPLYGASISATQAFAGGNTKTLTATTDNQGAYTLDALSAPTTLTVAAQGYITQTVDCDDLMTCGSNVTLPDVALNPITGAVVNVNLTYTPAHSEGESAETQNWYNDYPNVDYEVYNVTTGHAIKDISVQYPQIVLMEDVNDGDLLELTATSRNNSFNPVKATITIAEQKANATFNIVERGKVSSFFKENENSAVVGMLYDNDRKLVKTLGYSSDSLTIDDLNDGNYLLITMGKSELFNTIYDMLEFPSTGLKSGEDYINSSVVVNEGIISKVNIDKVPFLDESKLYYTGEQTSFTVNKSSIVIGNYLTFRAHVDFKEEHIDRISDVQLIIDLPESCLVYENSLLVGTTSGAYTLTNNKIIIPLSNYDDIVRFCAIPTVAGDFAPSAFVKFKIKGKSGYVTQPIGAARYTAKGLSINVPSKVPRISIPISGSAPGAMPISIYDNGVLIGKTTSLENGMWSTECELNRPYNLSIHYIHAVATTSSGIELKSEVMPCTYDKDAILVSKVHIYYRGKEILLDYINLNNESSYWGEYYSYVPGCDDFTFTIDFTDNDTTKIQDVTLYVKTSDNKWRILEAIFDSNKSLWVASGKFYEQALPINVSVDFLCLTEAELDLSIINDSYNEWNDIIARDDSINNYVNNVIDNLLAKLSTNDLTKEELLDSLDLILEFADLSEFIITPEIQDLLDTFKDLSGEELANALIIELEKHHFETSNDFESVYQQLTTPIQQELPSVNELPAFDVLMNESIETLNPILFSCDFEQHLNMIRSKRNRDKFEIIKLVHEDGSVITIDLSEQLPYPIDDSDESFEQWGLNAMDLWNSYLTSIGTENTLVIAIDGQAREITSKAYQELMLKKILIRNINWNESLPNDAIETLLNEVKNDAKNYHKARKVSNITSRSVQNASTLNKPLGFVSAFTGGWSIGSDIREGWNATKDWRRMIEDIKKCANPDAQELAEKAESYKQWIKDRYGLKGYADFAATGMGIAGVAAAPETFGASLLLNVGSGLLSLSTSHWEKNFKETNKRHWNEVYRELKRLGCVPEVRDTITIYVTGYPYPGPDMRICIDPSGFVYEGVPSNRLQGVTATCYYKETVEDMYGDTHEEIVLWDAEQYGQENPLLTDENGYYRWDVPIGMWQVKYEKAGYETTYSDWLPVPPPQLDVNIGMVQMRQPEVIKAHAYPKAVELEFDKFMFPETLTTDNITVSVNGTAVSGNIELLNAEKDDPLAFTSIRRAPGTGLTFASRVRFNSDQPFNADQVTLHVKQDVKSYADLQMNEDYEVTLPIEYEMEKIVANSTLIVPYGESRALTVTVMPAMASKGKTLNVHTTSSMIISTDAESYTLDNNGQTVVTVYGDLPGMGSLLFGIDGYNMSAATLVNVMMESQMTVATPTASIASGSEVEKGTAVYLSCSTEGATIYYTLDGSCPCDNTPARKVYDGTPIIINSTTTIKAMATAPDLYDSNVATFVYRVPNGLRGDVNGDGEVNIADVNALLDIVLGGQVDENTRARADVNADDEVNIADINAVIELILNPSNYVMNKVNCNDLLHIDDVTIKPGDIKTLNVTIDNASRYSAMQCDIVLPTGLTLVDILSVNGHINKTDELDENTMRAVNYSMDKRSYSGDGSPVMSLTVLADADLGTESEIKLTNVVLADAANKAWRVVDCSARISNTTGINDLTASIDRVWIEGNTLCIETRQDGVASIAAINGVTYDLDVKAGVNRYVLDAGLYVVIINGKGHKIAVK